MSELILKPTIAAQWQSLIQEAEQSGHLYLSEDLESYLVFLMIRYTGKPEIAKSVLALEFLDSSQAVGSQKREVLRDVGDKCLLISGLFPGRAQRKRVQISYFVELGQSAYTSLAQLCKQNLAALYESIGREFVPLMDILHIVREISADQTLLTPMQAEELWREVRSPHALNVLHQYSVSDQPTPCLCPQKINTH